jgi:hypothetical protein
VHSILYYRFDTTIVPDSTFDAWAQELALLQSTHPEDSGAVEYYREEFKDFAGETGFHLPLWDPRAQRVARYLTKNA